MRQMEKDTAQEKGEYRVHLDQIEEKFFTDEAPIFHTLASFNCQRNISEELRAFAASMNRYDRGGILGSKFASLILQDTQLFIAQLSLPSYVNHIQSCNSIDSPLCDDFAEDNIWQAIAPNASSVIHQYLQLDGQARDDFIECIAANR